MGIQEIIREKPAVGYTMVAVIGGLALFFLFSNLRPGPSSAERPRWAYDLNTKKLFIAYANQRPPVTTDSGQFAYPGLGEAGAGVDAYVYSCGEPAAVREGMTVDDLEAINARIGLISRTLPPELDKSAETGIEIELISDLNAENWVSGQSKPGFDLRSQALADCPDGSKPWFCVPY